MTTLKSFFFFYVFAGTETRDYNKLSHPQTHKLETQKGQVGLVRSLGFQRPSNPGYQHKERPARVKEPKTLGYQRIKRSSPGMGLIQEAKTISGQAQRSLGSEKSPEALDRQQH